MNFVAGDDWRLFVQLTDFEDKPYDLNSLSEIRWLLHNPFGEIAEHDYRITPLNASDGRISVWLPHDQTTDFAAGMWTDWIRIVCGPPPGIVSTVLTGPISVIADPWKARVAAAAHRSEASVVIMLDAKERIQHAALPDVAAENSNVHPIYTNETAGIGPGLARYRNHG